MPVFLAFYVLVSGLECAIQSGRENENGHRIGGHFHFEAGLELTDEYQIVPMDQFGFLRVAEQFLDFARCVADDASGIVGCVIH